MEPTITFADLLALREQTERAMRLLSGIQTYDLDYADADRVRVATQLLKKNLTILTAAPAVEAVPA